MAWWCQLGLATHCRHDDDIAGEVWPHIMRCFFGCQSTSKVCAMVPQDFYDGLPQQNPATVLG